MFFSPLAAGIVKKQRPLVPIVKNEPEDSGISNIKLYQTCRKKQPFTEGKAEI